MNYYLGCDIGTTGTKTMLFDEDNTFLSRGYKDYPLFTPFSGAYEQNPEDWYGSLKESIRQALAGKDINVSALSLSAQGGSFFLADVIDGKVIPLTKALTWMDKRAEQEFEELNKEISIDEIYHISGTRFGIGSVIARINWLKNHCPDVFNKAKIILSTADYVYYCLTGKLVIDYTSAAMMGMFNYKKLDWDERLVSLAKIKYEMLPKPISTGEYISTILPEVAKDLGINGSLKIYAGAHDQYAANIGSNYFSNDDLLISTGTTWVVFGKLQTPMYNEFYLAQCAHPVGGYGIFASAVSSGTVLAWEKENFCCESYEQINEAVENRHFDDNLMVYPFISGNGGYRKGKLSYSVQNVQMCHDKFDIIKASMEGVAFEIKKILQIFEEAGVNTNRIVLSGGATRSQPWMKILATILGQEIFISKQADRCCYGAYSIAKKGFCGKYAKFDFDGYSIMPDEKYVALYQNKFEKYNESLNK